MFPVLFGLAIMVWMWAAAMNHVVLKFAATASPAQQRVYLVMLVLAGSMVQVMMLAKVMPVSQLSDGWSLEGLNDLVRNAVVVASVVGGLALWRAHHLLPRFIVVRRRPS